MALRPIDNTPTPAPETDRPRKLPKISLPPASIEKKNRSETPMKNDENQAQPQPNAEAAFEYFDSEDLRPLADPQAKFQGLVEGLESKNWMVMCDSLNDVRRASIFHSDLLLPVLEKVLTALVKAMKNPRSTLCKTAIMASSDVFNSYGDELFENDEPGAFDQLLLQLLLKASQDKRFVCEEADKALLNMVKSAPPLRLLHKLQSYGGHGNLRVRAKAAVSISNCIAKMSAEELNEFGLVGVLRMAADMLNDRLPEAREAARSTVVSLYMAFPASEDDGKDEAWQQLCHGNLGALNAQAVIKITLSKLN